MTKTSQDIDRVIGFKILQSLEQKSGNQQANSTPTSPVLLKHGFNKVMEGVYKDKSKAFVLVSKLFHSKVVNALDKAINSLFRSNFISGFIASFLTLEIITLIISPELLESALLILILLLSALFGLIFDLIKSNTSI